MRFTKLSLFIAGAVGILMLGVPRAAHALAAALVQVANTASNPAVTQGIGNQAAQIVEIECGYLPGGNYLIGCVAVPPIGLLVAPPQYSQYTVPGSETLVVTAVDILSFSASSIGSPCVSPAFVQLLTDNQDDTSNRKSWIVASGAGTAHYVYPSGILFPPGTSIYSIGEPEGTCLPTLDLHGYLTAQ
jgi:hypothetical protein